MSEKRFSNVFVASVLITFAFTSSACSLRMANDHERMYILASSLTKLTAAVEAIVRYKNPPPGISEDQLLQMATQHDPALLIPFSEYKIKVLMENNHAGLLICSNEGNRGLLEDVGCTAELDKHLWQQTPLPPCEFTFRPSALCEGR